MTPHIFASILNRNDYERNKFNIVTNTVSIQYRNQQNDHQGHVSVVFYKHITSTTEKKTIILNPYISRPQYNSHGNQKAISSVKLIEVLLCNNLIAPKLQITL